MAVLWNADNSVPRLEWNAAKEFVAANKMRALLYDAHNNVEGLREVLVEIAQSAPDMLIVLNDPFMFTNRKIIVEAARRSGLPSIYGFREFVDDGGLISYGVSITGTYRRAAAYVHRILNGEKPADLPVQLPTEFELVVNLKAAKAMGISIPSSFLLRADEVIE